MKKLLSILQQTHNGEQELLIVRVVGLQNQFLKLNYQKASKNLEFKLTFQSFLIILTV